MENCWADRWNEGVTPRSICLNTAVCVSLVWQDYGMTPAEVGGNLPKQEKLWKLSGTDMQMIHRRSINCLWPVCRKADETLNVRVYKHSGRNAVPEWCVGGSKIFAVKLPAVSWAPETHRPRGAPKDRDVKISPSERGKTGTRSCHKLRSGKLESIEKYITIFCPIDRGGVVP